MIGIIMGVVVLVIVGGLGFFFIKAEGGGIDKVTSTSDDGAVTMSARFFNQDAGLVTGGVAQSLVGGTDIRTHVAFDLAVSNTGDVELTDVAPVSPNTNMNGAFNNVNPLSILATGVPGTDIFLGSTDQTCTNVDGVVCDALGIGGSTECDGNEECCIDNKCWIALDPYAGVNDGNPNLVEFEISVTGDFLLGDGSTATTNPSTVDLEYDIRGENCVGGVLIGSCDVGNEPSYCSHTPGSAPLIIDKASVCGCPPGEEASGESCVLLTCADSGNTQVADITDPAGCTPDSDGTYGAIMHCHLVASTPTLEPGCNTCGCTLDAQGNSEDSCDGSDPASCIWRSYQGELDATISE